jgi:hypothetical protein
METVMKEIKISDQVDINITKDYICLNIYHPPNDSNWYSEEFDKEDYDKFISSLIEVLSIAFSFEKQTEGITKCSRCQKEIKFLKTPNDKWMPVDVMKPISIVDKNGATHRGWLPHWFTCKYANAFRKKQPKSEKVENEKNI